MHGVTLSSDSQFLVTFSKVPGHSTIYIVWNAFHPEEALATFSTSQEESVYFIGDLNGDFYFDLKERKGKHSLVKLKLPKISSPSTLETVNIGDFNWVDVCRSGLLVFTSISRSDDIKTPVSLQRSQRITLREPNTLEEINHIDFPTDSAIVGSWANQSHDEVLISIGSFTRAEELRRVNLATGLNEFLYSEQSRRWEPKLKGATSIQFDIRTSDNEILPVEMSGRNLQSRDSSRSVLIDVYGSHGMATVPRFDPFAAVWMENGGLYVVAHVRGGGGKSPEWSHMGRGPKGKRRAMFDVVDVAKWLVSNGFSRPGAIAVRGISSGGILAAGALHLSPDLFGAGVLISPVLDLLNFHRYTRGTYWLEEFGDPEREGDRLLLKDIDPVSNISKTPLKNNLEVFLAFSEGDQYVSPQHAFAYIESWQKEVHGRKIWVQAWPGSSHAWAGNPEEEAKTNALILSFLTKKLRNDEDK